MFGEETKILLRRLLSTAVLRSHFTFEGINPRRIKRCKASD